MNYIYTSIRRIESQEYTVIEKDIAISVFSKIIFMSSQINLKKNKLWHSSIRGFFKLSQFNGIYVTGLCFVVLLWSLTVIAWKKNLEKFMLTLFFIISQKWNHLYLSLMLYNQTFPPFFSSPNSDLSLIQSNFIELGTFSWIWSPLFDYLPYQFQE